MKQLLFLCAFLFSIGACFGQTQLEMNEAGRKTFDVADKELNTVFRRVLEKYKEDTAFVTNLRAAQRIWVRFRDAEMKAMYPDRKPGYYGSIHPLCWFEYKTELTRARTNALKIWFMESTRKMPADDH